MPRGPGGVAPVNRNELIMLGGCENAAETKNNATAAAKATLARRASIRFIITPLPYLPKLPRIFPYQTSSILYLGRPLVNLF
jgi:hypothetical protein